MNQNKPWINIKSNKIKNGTSFFETFNISDYSRVTYSVLMVGDHTPD